MADPVARLERADADRRDARERIESVGEGDLRDLREAVADLREILTAYEDRAVRDEDFAAFIEFQDRIGHFTNDLPEDLPERDTFEAIDDLLQQRRLVESDFAEARERLNEAEAALEPLEDWEDATDRYREARRAVGRRLDEVRDEIADRERLQRLGEADLDAPVERLRDPIETYDANVREAFASFRADSSARAVLDFLATTTNFPLVPFERPPDDLREFVRTHEAGTESIPQLLEYAGFSRSKLDHYVEDPDALKRAVATQQTYLERLDAGPLTVDWPPPEADVLRWQCDERISVVGRFAPDVVPDLRRVRELTRREDYDRLRTTAQARDQLTDTERERLRSGAVEQELAELREEREQLEAALETYPER
ncbi:hypothetical protein OB920_18065 [Halobacteria archaeon HArc-gm2]|nr:hypothetical protein [Halobacteria archaeon HArc-gm2]